MTNVHYTRSEWQACFSEASLHDLPTQSTAVPPSEIETIYAPLVSLIFKWKAANEEKTQKVKGAFGLIEETKAPFLIGVAGSVAAGKSTTSQLIAELLSTVSPGLKVDTLSTDHFLYPNAELQTRGIMNRKGFPESYDWELLHQILADLKKGSEVVHTPIYSHAVYDITGEMYELRQPDVVILEGINVLQAGYGFRPISDWLDLKIYVDAEEAFVFDWYWKRVQSLVAIAHQNPDSYFNQFREMDHGALYSFAKRIWRDINAVNLHDYILPSRERADLILEKGPDHSIQNIIVNFN